jgi:hypothetical protein
LDRGFTRLREGTPLNRESKWHSPRRSRRSRRSRRGRRRRKGWQSSGRSGKNLIDRKDSDGGSRSGI